MFRLKCFREDSKGHSKLKRVRRSFKFRRAKSLNALNTKSEITKNDASSDNICTTIPNIPSPSSIIEKSNISSFVESQDPDMAVLEMINYNPDLPIPIKQAISSEDNTGSGLVLEAGSVSTPNNIDAQVKYALGESLRLVIKSLTAPMVRLIEIADTYLDLIENALLAPNRPMNCSLALEYLTPLLCIDYKSDGNRLTVFDRTCGRLIKITSEYDQEHDIHASIMKSICPMLIYKSSKTGSIFSAIAFETALYILSYAEISMDIVNLIVKTRQDNEQLYTHRFLEFRLYRAEYLRVLMIRSCRKLEKRAALAEACGAEIKASAFWERDAYVAELFGSTMKEIQKRYRHKRVISNMFFGVPLRSRSLYVSSSRSLLPEKREKRLVQSCPIGGE